MTEKDKELAQKIAKMRLPTKGINENILHLDSLYQRIRTRLNFTKKQLPNKVIKQTIKHFNTELTKFLFNNPEGLYLEVGNKLHGVLAISKHMPKEFRENKYETYEDIENTKMPDWKKKIILKRYNTSVERRQDRNKAKNGENRIHANPHSHFYTYKFVWFNHRNCSFIKSRAWIFEVARAAKNELYEIIKKGEKDYYEWNFNDFYHYKVKPIE
jgi:hypothetical protein